MDIFELPWGSPVQWREINETIDFMTDLYRTELAEAMTLARDAEKLLESLFPLMDELCAVACPSCREPCCRVARLWFNFPDLLFLHLSGQNIAEGQPHKEFHLHCRYLGDCGCTLPRIERPWICTWYLCPPQTSLLRKKGKSVKNRVDQIFTQIKEKRKAMEDEFIRVIS
ncbi:MAG: hypothetical protein AB7S75_03870 [Desulfococcaceae bacterium]